MESVLGLSVFDLARVDTQLKKVAASEYAGPCPGCGGRDRFHVNLRKRNGQGGWMCRVCRPAELQGWGDDVDYLVAFRNMSTREALQVARNQINTLLDQAREALPYAAPTDEEPPLAPWQEKTREYVENAVYRLWHTDAGRAALEYARVRGLEDSTIKAAQIGFSIDYDLSGVSVPYLTIPWHVGGGQSGYWAVNRRDMREDKPDDAPRYKMLYGSSKQGLYGGSLLVRSRKFLTFLVEGELDMLILAQEARGLDVNAVATGGQTSILTRWAVRLSRMPLVLLAQDNEDKGNKLARAWHDVLPNAKRYRPLAKDVNAMLVEGWGVRTWVEAALDMLQPVEPSNLNRALFPAHDDQPADQSGPAGLEAMSTPDHKDSRVVAALPGAPVDVLEDVTALLSLLDQDQAATWLRDVSPAWSGRDSAALFAYAEQIDYPGDRFLLRCSLQDRPAGEDITLDLEIDQSGAGLQDAGAAFLDQVTHLVTGILPDGWTARLVDDAFAARIHALPDLVPQAAPAPGILEALPRLKCPAEIMATRAIPGETTKNRSQVARTCGQKTLVNGWCKDHQKAALLLDMGAALGYPRVEVSDCNIIPAGRRGWERYSMGDGGFRAALPRVKRLLDQAQRDQNPAAS